MKTPAKVFIWIGMILQFFLIYPIILGIFALEKINTATSKNELQTLGIFTTIFCSLLGGIFMLCIKDEELNETAFFSDNGVAVYRKEQVAVTYENENTDPVKWKARKAIKILLYSLIGALVLSLVFSISGAASYYGGFLPLIFVGLQLIIYAVLVSLYIIRKHTLSKLTNGLLIAFAAISAIEIVISMITNFELAWFDVWNYNWVTKKYYSSICYLEGGGWQYWCLFALALICVGIGCTALYLSFKTKQSDSVNTEKTINKKITYTRTSRFEMELTEVKRLFDTEIITNEEYQRIRKAILDKYYNVST